jgi:hypothetical protein
MDSIPPKFRKPTSQFSITLTMKNETHLSFPPELKNPHPSFSQKKKTERDTQKTQRNRKGEFELP